MWRSGGPHKMTWWTGFGPFNSALFGDLKELLFTTSQPQWFEFMTSLRFKKKVTSNCFAWIKEFDNAVFQSASPGSRLPAGFLEMNSAFVNVISSTSAFSAKACKKGPQRWDVCASQLRGATIRSKHFSVVCSVIRQSLSSWAPFSLITEPRWGGSLFLSRWHDLYCVERENNSGVTKKIQLKRKIILIFSEAR